MLEQKRDLESMALMIQALLGIAEVYDSPQNHNNAVAILNMAIGLAKDYLDKDLGPDGRRLYCKLAIHVIEFLIYTGRLQDAIGWSDQSADWLLGLMNETGSYEDSQNVILFLILSAKIKMQQNNFTEANVLLLRALNIAKEIRSDSAKIIERYIDKVAPLLNPKRLVLKAVVLLVKVMFVVPILIDLVKKFLEQIMPNKKTNVTKVKKGILSERKYTKILNQYVPDYKADENTFRQIHAVCTGIPALQVSYDDQRPSGMRGAARGSREIITKGIADNRSIAEKAEGMSADREKDFKDYRNAALRGLAKSIIVMFVMELVFARFMPNSAFVWGLDIVSFIGGIYVFMKDPFLELVHYMRTGGKWRRR